MMKTKALLLGSLLFAAGLNAEENKAGPKGGRLLASEPNRTEFLVVADGKLELNFYDASLSPTAAGPQQVTVIAEPSSGRRIIEMMRTENGLVSKEPLPEGAPYRVVVQTRSAQGEKPKNFRVDLNLATCAECQHAEYACTCEGH
jgi:hypothetical protein